MYSQHSHFLNLSPLYNSLIFFNISHPLYKVLLSQTAVGVPVTHVLSEQVEGSRTEVLEGTHPLVSEQQFELSKYSTIAPVPVSNLKI